MENKKVPNPWGKKGCPEHQEEINKLEDAIEDEGYDAKREFHVPTPNGKKSRRFVDIASTDKESGEPIEFYQVMKVNKDGKPPKREEEALDDVEEKTGKRPIIKPYNLIIFALIFLTGALIFEAL